MAKVDWDLHRQQYAKLSSEKGITAREYAEHYGLNINTARRELKKSLIRDQNSDQNGDQNSDQKGDHPNKKGKSDHKSTESDSRSGSSNTSKNNGIDKKGRTNGRKNTPDQTGESNDDGQTTNAKMINSPVGTEIVHVKKPRGEGKRHQQGNETSIKTGARATPREVDFIVADKLIDEGIEALATRALRESLAHMNQVQRAIGKAVEVMDDEIKAFQETPPKDDDDSASFGTHPTLKKAKLLMEAGYLFIAHNSMLSGVITAANKVELERRKVVVAEDKADNNNLATKIIKQAIELRDEFEWDDIQTVEYIESFGIKAPASLMARAVKAIAEIAPVIEETGNVNEAELDAEARAYAAAKIKAAQDVEQRRKDVAALTDGLGLGDITDQNERKSGELDDDYSHLDIDYEATNELYGEDIPPSIDIEDDSE